MMTVVVSGVVAVGMIAPAAAQEHDHAFCTDAGLPGHSEYGQHVATMAREGHFGADHHPGHHQGYAVCLTEDE
jgi:hypothetical protein